MAISNAFKSAYTSEQNAQFNTANTISTGIKDIGRGVLLALGFASGTMSTASGTIGKLAGIGGSLAQATMSEKVDKSALYDIKNAEKVDAALYDLSKTLDEESDQALDTVYNKIMKAREISKQNAIEMDLLSRIEEDEEL